MIIGDSLSNEEKLFIALEIRHKMEYRIGLLVSDNSEYFPTFSINSFIPEQNETSPIYRIHNTCHSLIQAVKLINNKLEKLGYQNV